MPQLGFSLYPETHTPEEIHDYIDLLHRYGAKRLFMSWLQNADKQEETFKNYQKIIHYSNEREINVVLDVSPTVIKSSGWQNHLIEMASQLGLSGLRLDEALPLEEIVTLTHNPYDIKIELNMSTDKRLLTALLDENAKSSNLIACHNFYPHEFTGLSLDYFIEMSQFYKSHGIKTAAFVSAQSANEGPWPLSEGLPTLEKDRHLPIRSQIKFMKATGLIDDIIIANQFISEKELETCVEIFKENCISLDVKSIVSLTPIEKEIIQFPHHYRGDRSDYVIRSTQPRLVFAEESIPKRQDNKDVRRGSIIIDNDLYTRYKGELQIALTSFKISEKANLVAQIIPEDVVLLSYLDPWQDFRLNLLSD
ncbi:DUF871 domain-containing protein [Streptococcus zalophi]|uniref:DUF871 domain-containing protein n=1 Tax=Streptococcus zalophi TaxID=640031 RepID=UPI00215D29AC|nr:MupG family TIM beta-alpha barrel fold protein [Streptococcus zalophi]MCR8967775.1 MupG family TIM beta-alpha barrel fold protein [Streptococcus zalophi]